MKRDRKKPKKIRCRPGYYLPKNGAVCQKVSSRLRIPSAQMPNVSNLTPMGKLGLGVGLLGIAGAGAIGAGGLAVGLDPNANPAVKPLLKRHQKAAAHQNTTQAAPAPTPPQTPAPPKASQKRTKKATATASSSSVAPTPTPPPAPQVPPPPASSKKKTKATKASTTTSPQVPPPKAVSLGGSSAASPSTPTPSSAPTPTPPPASQIPPPKAVSLGSSAPKVEQTKPPANPAPPATPPSKAVALENKAKSPPKELAGEQLNLFGENSFSSTAIAAAKNIEQAKKEKTPVETEKKSAIAPPKEEKKSTQQVKAEDKKLLESKKETKAQSPKVPKEEYADLVQKIQAAEDLKAQAKASYVAETKKAKNEWEETLNSIASRRQALRPEALAEEDIRQSLQDLKNEEEAANRNYLAANSSRAKDYMKTVADLEKEIKAGQSQLSNKQKTKAPPKESSAKEVKAPVAEAKPAIAAPPLAPGKAKRTKEIVEAEYDAERTRKYKLQTEHNINKQPYEDRIKDLTDQIAQTEAALPRKTKAALDAPELVSMREELSKIIGKRDRLVKEFNQQAIEVSQKVTKLERELEVLDRVAPEKSSDKPSERAVEAAKNLQQSKAATTSKSNTSKKEVALASNPPDGLKVKEAKIQAHAKFAEEAYWEARQGLSNSLTNLNVLIAEEEERIKRLGLNSKKSSNEADIPSNLQSYRSTKAAIEGQLSDLDANYAQEAKKRDRQINALQKKITQEESAPAPSSVKEVKVTPSPSSKPTVQLVGIIKVKPEEDKAAPSSPKPESTLINRIKKSKSVGKEKTALGVVAAGHYVHPSGDWELIKGAKQGWEAYPTGDFDSKQREGLKQSAKTLESLVDLVNKTVSWDGTKRKPVWESE